MMRATIESFEIAVWSYHCYIVFFIVYHLESRIDVQPKERYVWKVSPRRIMIMAEPERADGMHAYVFASIL